MLTFKVAGSYPITKALSVNAAYNYVKYRKMYDDVLWQEKQPDNTIDSLILKNSAGANLETTMLSFALVYSF